MKDKFETKNATSIRVVERVDVKGNIYFIVEGYFPQSHYADKSTDYGWRVVTPEVPSKEHALQIAESLVKSIRSENYKSVIGEWKV